MQVISPGRLTRHSVPVDEIKRIIQEHKEGQKSSSGESKIVLGSGGSSSSGLTLTSESKSSSTGSGKSSSTQKSSGGTRTADGTSQKSANTTSGPSTTPTYEQIRYQQELKRRQEKERIANAVNPAGQALQRSGVNSYFDKAMAEADRTMIGRLYHFGNGTAKDMGKAVEWYTKAADQELTESMYTLAVLYYHGKEVQQDYARALSLMRKAAEAGYHGAIADMGVIYSEGKAVEKDMATAIKWHEKAAKFGRVSALTHLAVIYLRGDGVEKDPAKAHELLQIALKKNPKHSEANANIGVLYYEGDAVPQNYAVALQHFETAAQEIHDNSQLYYLMARCYWETSNKPKSREYFQKAADMDNKDAIQWLKDNN